MLPFFSIGDLWDNLNRPDRVTFPKTPLRFGEIRDTPPKFNMEPENASLERETHRLKPPVLGFHVKLQGCTTTHHSHEQLTITTFCEFFYGDFLMEELWRMACLKLASNPPDEVRLALEATLTSQKSVCCVNGGVVALGGRVSASCAKGSYKSFFFEAHMEP